MWSRRVGWAAALGIAIAALWLVFRAAPVAVDVATVARGAMEVTVDQEGEIRVHDRYVIAAPVTGRMVRIELHDGDAVSVGQRVAELEPAPLDPRGRQEALARIAAAQALVREAQQNTVQADAQLRQAQREQSRMEQLVRERFVAEDAADKARTGRASARAALSAARARESAARFELAAAQSALLAIPGADGRTARHITLSSPVSGRVLRVLEQSERTVPAGAPLMMIGDPGKFEAVADVLSSDAVRIREGNDARLEEWGGDRALRARVRTVEPYAFTKVSPLGIEEKRVNVVLDPVDSLGPLGDGYRVMVRVVVWSSPDVLQVPASALFRGREGDAVFVVADGRARIKTVRVGQRNSREAEVLEGLAVGELVIRYPTNDLADGSQVAATVVR